MININDLKIGDKLKVNTIAFQELIPHGSIVEITAILPFTQVIKVNIAKPKETPMYFNFYPAHFIALTKEDNYEKDLIMTSSKRNEILLKLLLSDDIIITFANGESYKGKLSGFIHDSISILIRDKIKEVKQVQRLW